MDLSVEIAIFAGRKRMVRGNFGFPLLLYKQEAMLKENEIAGFLRELLDEEAFKSYFLLDFKLHNNKKLEVILDSDGGVGFDVCQKVSRRLEQWLDENLILGTDYVLEVSSPGVERPLLLLRQYPKHKGRTLSVRLNDGSETEGILEDVTDETISLLVKNGKTKQKSVEFPFEDIREAFVRISFK